MKQDASDMKIRNGSEL